MSPVQLAPGVWRIPTAPYDLVNSFLFEASDGSLTLLDAGTKRAPKTVLAGLAALGKRRENLTHLLLSHAHNDHAGGARAVLEASGGVVWAHEREAVYLREGRMPMPDQRSRGGRLLARLPAGNFAAIDVADTFVDGAVLPLAGGLQVIHTPGHTPGHSSFLHPSSGVLVTGDALFNVRGLRYSLKAPCTDVSLSRTSANRLGELDFEVAGFTHGAHVSSDAPATVRAFLAGRPG